MRAVVKTFDLKIRNEHVAATLSNRLTDNGVIVQSLFLTEPSYTNTERTETSRIENPIANHGGRCYRCILEREIATAYPDLTAQEIEHTLDLALVMCEIKTPGVRCY